MIRARRFGRTCAVASAWLLPFAACGGSSGGGPGTLNDGGSGTDATRPSADGAPQGAASAAVPDSSPPPLPDGGAPKPAATCTSPIQPVDTSKPDTVVGIGTAASCTEASLAAAVAKAGVV